MVYRTAPFAMTLTDP